MRKIIITIGQLKGKPGCEGCGHQGIGRFCDAFLRVRRTDKLGKPCRLRACTSAENRLRILEKKASGK